MQSFFIDKPQFFKFNYGILEKKSYDGGETGSSGSIFGNAVKVDKERMNLKGKKTKSIDSSNLKL
ncbi:MAG: hypothetical protein ACXV7J_00185 [Methylomonas sp.]